jgi:hypothetical protein
MPKPHPIQINIPNPCLQKWEEMTPDGRGRHCDHCRKTVIDFTTWSDAALYIFFSNYQGDVCGRFLATQTDRHIHIPHQPHSRLYRMTVALGLTLIFSQATNAYAQFGLPRVTKSVPINSGTNKGSSPAEPCKIRGLVTDINGVVIPGAIIHFSKGGVYEVSVTTDSVGEYIARHLVPGTYNIVAEAEGYNLAEVGQVEVTPQTGTVKDIRMEKSPRLMKKCRGATFMTGEVDYKPAKRSGHRHRKGK